MTVFEATPQYEPAYRQSRFFSGDSHRRVQNTIRTPMTHHVHILEMNSENYRLTESRHRQKNTKKTNPIKFGTPIGALRNRNLGV